MSAFNFLKHFHHDHSGGTVLETTLVAPTWILLLTILIQLTLIYYAKSVTEYATSRAARVAVVQIPRQLGGEPPNVLVLKGKKHDAIHSAATEPLTLLTDNPKPLVNVKITGSLGGKFPETGMVTVDVDFDYPMTIPVASALIGTDGKLTLSSRATFRNEGVGLRPGEL